MFEKYELTSFGKAIVVFFVVVVVWAVYWAGHAGLAALQSQPPSGAPGEPSPSAVFPSASVSPSRPDTSPSPRPQPPADTIPTEPAASPVPTSPPRSSSADLWGRGFVISYPRGDSAAYATDWLSFSDAISNSGVQWDITGVRMEAAALPDESADLIGRRVSDVEKKLRESGALVVEIADPIFALSGNDDSWIRVFYVPLEDK